MRDRDVTALIGRFVATWNAKDIPALGALFAEDADFVDVIGNLAEGRREIERLHRYPFASIQKDATLSEVSLTSRVLAEDIVFGDYRWKCTGSVGRDGEPLPVQLGNISFVMKAAGESAQFITVRNSNYTGGARFHDRTSIIAFDWI